MCMSRNLWRVVYRCTGVQLYRCIGIQVNRCRGIQVSGVPAPPAHGAPVLGLLDLQLREQLDKPLEALLVPVDPEEVNLCKYLR